MPEPFNEPLQDGIHRFQVFDSFVFHCLLDHGAKERDGQFRIAVFDLPCGAKSG
jgi:hypothetical protein